ncbi:hypothetical protein D3C78_839030 [compost metagenome]
MLTCCCTVPVALLTAWVVASVRALLACCCTALVAPPTACLAEFVTAWVAPCCMAPTTLPSREPLEPVNTLPTSPRAVAWLCHPCIALGQLGVAAVRFSPNTWVAPSLFCSMTESWLVSAFHTMPACLAISGTGA